eukprot:TRINITY_DN4521_c1_g1_i5.p2 TRINITY_DN4521_c1_g1~~TRINITY_DN4521_c1_g1_i5.p2  ORF type:complete len:136 (-),score=17.06 TRINITY_DN4521_c1_g1_i5:638-1045(-)
MRNALPQEHASSLRAEISNRSQLWWRMRVLCCYLSKGPIRNWLIFSTPELQANDNLGPSDQEYYQLSQQVPRISLQQQIEDTARELYFHQKLDILLPLWKVGQMWVDEQISLYTSIANEYDVFGDACWEAKYTTQ